LDSGHFFHETRWRFKFNETEDSLTTTVDELKLGTTPAAIKGELEFTFAGR
jgi:hypothetical protein